MLQKLLKSRTIFLIILTSLWLLIFAVPYIGRVNRRSIVRGAKNIRDSILGSKRSNKVADIIRKTEITNKSDKGTDDPLYDYYFAGEFRQGNLCLDNVDGTVGSVIGLWECHGEGGNQFWFIRKNKNLKSKNLCAEGPADLESIVALKLQRCSEKASQAWEYIKGQQLIRLIGSNLCIEAEGKNRAFLNKCDKKRKSQKWTFKTPPGM